MQLVKIKTAVAVCMVILSINLLHGHFVLEFGQVHLPLKGMLQ